MPLGPTKATGSSAILRIKQLAVLRTSQEPKPIIIFCFKGLLQMIVWLCKIVDKY